GLFRSLRSDSRHPIYMTHIPRFDNTKFYSISIRLKIFCTKQFASFQMQNMRRIGIPKLVVFDCKLSISTLSIEATWDTRFCWGLFSLEGRHLPTPIADSTEKSGKFRSSEIFR